MTGIHLTFTYPPSANRMWRNYRGRTVKSEEYEAWLNLNATLSLQERFQKISGPYALTILATAPDKRRRDLDNLAKPTSDLLQFIGAVSDDCNMQRLVMEWAPGPGAGVTVAIQPLGAAVA